jgi:hypothetical protein
MMLRATFQTEATNKAFKDGSVPKILEATMAKLKPEAAYFAPHNGKRCAMLFFDMKDPSDIPSICEPLFSALNAEIELHPVMNAEDLQRGLKAL